MIRARERWIVKTKAVIHRKKWYVAVYLGVGLSICVFFPQPLCRATGNTLYVGPGQTFEKIQDAITAAQPGDTIYVFEGTYRESIRITKDLTLTGERRDTTYITYGTDGHIVEIQGSESSKIIVNISGFTIQNALGQGYDSIACSYMQGGTITNTKLLNSAQSDGIQLYQCSGVTISNNVIMNNKGSGISIIRSSANTIYSNTIQGNQKGIYLYLASNDNVIYSNTLTRNTQYGIYVVQSSGNQFYLNDFVTNGMNAYDSSSNLWYKNQQGNYWSDYNNYDEDKNGIGDVSYTIAGNSNQDMYPLGYFLESTQNPEGSTNQKPTAYQPSITPNPANFGDPVSMSGSGTDADGWIEGYHWRSSRDGVLSTSSSFTTRSLSEGTHTIYFKVKDNEGSWSTEKTVILTINPRTNQAPTAVIDSIEPNPSFIGKNITFIGHGFDEDGTITEWRWISSIDGELGSEATCILTSLSVGRHTIYFQVRDNEGKWSKQVSQILTVLEQNYSAYPLNKPPHAHAGGPYYGNVGDILIFDGSQSYDEDGTIVEYRWDFDDGRGNGSTPAYQFNTRGEFTIVLTVVDDKGYMTSDTTTAYIGIHGQTDNTNQGAHIFAFPQEMPLFVFILIPLLIIGAVLFVFFYVFKK